MLASFLMEKMVPAGLMEKAQVGSKGEGEGQGVPSVVWPNARLPGLVIMVVVLNCLLHTTKV